MSTDYQDLPDEERKQIAAEVAKLLGLMRYYWRIYYPHRACPIVMPDQLDVKGRAYLLAVMRSMLHSKLEPDQIDDIVEKTFTAHGVSY